MNEHILILQGYIEHLEYMKKNADDFFDRKQADENIEAFKAAIKALEQEPNTGHWITKPHIYGVAFCSECDFELRIDDTKYCPNCGAKMFEPQEREEV